MTNALENDTLYPYDYDSIKFSVIICLTWGIQLNILKGWFLRKYRYMQLAEPMYINYDDICLNSVIHFTWQGTTTLL